MVPATVVDGVGFDVEEASRWAGSVTFRRFGGFPAGPLPTWGCRTHPAADIRPGPDEQGVAGGRLGCGRSHVGRDRSPWGGSRGARPLVFDALVAAAVPCVVSPPKPLAERVVFGVLGHDAGAASLRRTRFVAVAGDGPEPSLFVVDRGTRSYR
ncbi:hypothetical protein GCM10027517_11850 [Phycicoccus ginsengisoli]